MFNIFSAKPKAQYRMLIDGSELEAPLKAGQTLLESGISAKLKFPNMCNVGECGTCRCQVVEGNIRLKSDIRRHVSREEMQQGYVLACQSIAEGDVTVRVPGLSVTDTSLTTCAGRIASVVSFAHDILEVRVSLDQAITYVAGQYAQLTVPGVVELAETPRNYSFATDVAGDDSKTAVFYIRHVPGGLFTDWLFAADRTGERLHVAGPYGDFHYRATGRPLLCMAGGSGLAPIKAMLEQLYADGIARPVTLLFGAQKQRDLYCLEELHSLAATWPVSFSFHPVLSNEPPDSGWSGLRGFVTDQLSRTVPNLADHDAYLCGPPAMLDAVFAKVAGQIPDERIHFDKFLDQSSLQAIKKTA